MADYIVKDTELTSVANAIRTAGGTNSLLSFPNGFVSAVNNISGGGGSSDFSTATVTIINNNEYGLNIPAVYNAGELFPDAPAFLYTASMGYQGVFTVALYKGTAVVEIPFGDDVAIDGNITDMEYGFYFITGDCTITIS